MGPFEIAAQVVGIIAVTIFVLSYLQKSRRNIIILNVTSRILYILQYLLLGAISGAALDILGAVASVVAGKKDSPFIKRHKKLIMILIDGAIIIAGLAICIINKNPLDLLPIAGVLLHTGAFWMSDERIIRRISLVGSPCWLAYNLASRAYGSAVGDTLSICSIIVAMIRYRKREKSDKA